MFGSILRRSCYFGSKRVSIMRQSIFGKATGPDPASDMQYLKRFFGRIFRTAAWIGVGIGVGGAFLTGPVLLHKAIDSWEMDSLKRKGENAKSILEKGRVAYENSVKATDAEDSDRFSELANLYWQKAVDFDADDVDELVYKWFERRMSGVKGDDYKENWMKTFGIAPCDYGIDECIKDFNKYCMANCMARIKVTTTRPYAFGHLVKSRSYKYHSKKMHVKVRHSCDYFFGRITLVWIDGQLYQVGLNARI